nr:hypothetical protein [Arabidopsis thaliana]
MAHDLKEMLGTKATLKVIQKTSHIPQTEKSKEFNGFVMSFLLPPSPSP